MEDLIDLFHRVQFVDPTPGTSKVYIDVDEN